MHVIAISWILMYNVVYIIQTGDTFSGVSGISKSKYKMANTKKSENTENRKKNKETVIISQYQYTDVLMQEVEDAWAMHTYRNYISLVIITLICAFFTWREGATHKMTLAVLFAVVGIICLSAVIASFISINKKKSAAVKQFHETYHGKGFEYVITIEGNRIRSYKDGIPGVDLRKNDIRGTFESERFFVFQLTGEQLLPLKKDSFVKGNIESCRSYVPQLNR